MQSDMCCLCDLKHAQVIFAPPLCHSSPFSTAAASSSAFTTLRACPRTI
jgi:hypothetical protein